jgi:hypothetical protein
MGTVIKERRVSEERQSQMMLTCAFCGEATTPPSVIGGLLTIRSEEGHVGAFAVHSGCAIERMHPRAQALLAAAPVIPLPD